MLQSCLEVAKLAVDGGARQLALEFHPHQKHQLACASQSGSVFVVDSMTTRNAAMFPGKDGTSTDALTSPDPQH